MKYIHSFKGGIIFLILFSLLVFYIPVISYPLENVKIILTVSTFLFAILAGFFISRLSSRYSLLREGYSYEDAELLTFYKLSEFLGEGFIKKITEILDKYYITVFDFIATGDSYKKTNLYFFLLYNEIRKIRINIKNEVILSKMLDCLRSLERYRNKTSELIKDKLTWGQWFILFFLSLIIISCIFYLRENFIYSNVTTVLLSTSIVLVLLIMRDIQNLNISKDPIGVETAAEAFDYMNKLRYYHMRHLKSGYIKVPKYIKKYRLGLHKPGEKYKIKIISKK